MRGTQSLCYSVKVWALIRGWALSRINRVSYMTWATSDKASSNLANKTSSRGD